MCCCGMEMASFDLMREKVLYKNKKKLCPYRQILFVKVI